MKILSEFSYGQICGLLACIAADAWHDSPEIAVGIFIFSLLIIIFRPTRPKIF